MNQDIDSLILINRLSNDEFDKFKSAIQILTSRTFIIRALDKERQLYDFTIRNIRLFEAWFLCMDASLVRDESLGVIAFRGSGSSRLRFSKDEICAVLVLRLLYEEKKLEVTLTKFPVMSVRDFQDKYNAMTGGEINKTTLDKVLARLVSSKLISVESNDYTNPESIIQLYPSIPFSIDRSALDTAVAMLKQKDITTNELEDTQEESE